MDMNLAWQCFPLKAAWGVSSRTSNAQKCTNTCKQSSTLVGILLVRNTTQTWKLKQIPQFYFEYYVSMILSKSPIRTQTSSAALTNRQQVRIYRGFHWEVFNTSNFLSVPPLFSTTYFSSKWCTTQKASLIMYHLSNTEATQSAFHKWKTCIWTTSKTINKEDKTNSDKGQKDPELSKGKQNCSKGNNK